MKLHRYHLLLPTLFFIILSISISHGASQFDHGGTLKRLLILEENNTNEANTSSRLIILAANKTKRRDPLNHFEYYTGGLDYTDTHYWASVTYTGAPLFITAIVWFVVLGFFLFCACLCCYCCRKRKLGYSRIAYALSLIFLILSSISTLSGCVVLFRGQDRFNNSIAETLSYILKTGASIFDSCMSVVTALTSAAKITVNQISLPPEIKDHIDAVDKMVRLTAKIPKVQSLANTDNIRRVLSPASLALDILGAVMLILVVLGLLFSLKGLQCLMYILLIFGWLLVTMTFILSGVFLVFRNVVADTCVAMDDWLQNPNANTTLSLQVLPCMDPTTARETFNASRETTSSLIDIVNKYITEDANKDYPPEAGVLYHNQTGPLVPTLSNPYDYELTDRSRDSAQVNFSNVQQEWSRYVCQVSPANICITPGRLTPNAYNEIMASVNISITLHESTQSLIDFADCNLVLKTFGDISRYYCPGLRHHSFRTYAGLVIASASVMCSLVSWVIYTRERRKRRYTKKKLRCLTEEKPLRGLEMRTLSWQTETNV